MSHINKYTKDERARIVALLISNGYPDKEGSLRFTQNNLNIDKGQLRRWFDFPDKYCNGWDNIERFMMVLKDLIETELNSVFEEMGVKREKASYKDLSVAFGILADKLLVLQNRPTNITANFSDWKAVIEKERGNFDPREETN